MLTDSIKRENKVPVSLWQDILLQHGARHPLKLGYYPTIDVEVLDKGMPESHNWEEACPISEKIYIQPKETEKELTSFTK